jgi:TorA maturation chaperone TorD
MSTREISDAEIPSVTPEDQARAAIYALLARLWYAGPDVALLSAIAQAGDIVGEGEQIGLASAWRELRAAALDTAPEAACNEYDDVFIGTGKAAVSLYASHYLIETAREPVLVALRDKLMELGLARTSAAQEPEDHLAALCEVMRHLIARGSSDTALQQQREFFTRFLAGAYNAFVSQTMSTVGVSFYARVARVTKAFFDIEVASFEMI